MANSPALQAGRPLPPWWDARCLLEWSWRRSSGPGRIGSSGPTVRLSGRNLLLPPSGEMLSAMLRRSHSIAFLIMTVLALSACERRGGCTGANCGTLVNAAVAEPPTLLPPSSEDIVAKDIDEQLFLKLAAVGVATHNTPGADEVAQPLLAQKWEGDGPLTRVFHLDPRARWQDGTPVTASDVEFTFNAYNDSAVASPYRAKLKRVASVTQRDSLTAVFRFRERVALR